MRRKAASLSQRDGTGHKGVKLASAIACWRLPADRRVLRRLQSPNLVVAPRSSLVDEVWRFGEGEVLLAAVTGYAVLIPDGLDHAGIIHVPRAPGFRAQRRRLSGPGVAIVNRRLGLVLVAADARARHARRGLHERAHALDQAHVFIKHLEIQRPTRWRLEVNRPVLVDRREAVVNLGGEGQRGTDQERLVEGVWAAGRMV